jgi:hypothetical protein
MTSNPDNGGSINAKPLKVDPTGQDPAAKDPAADVKLQLQLAIFDVTKDAQGKSLEEILQRLRSAFAAHGVRTPPGTWLESVASSAFYGEPYIIDLPAAIAADAVVPAPDGEVADRLAVRRELREEKLPPGTLPSPADWDVPANEITRTGRTDRAPSVAVSRSRGANGTAMVAVAVAAAVAVAVLAVRGSRRPPFAPAGGVK